MTWFFVEFAPSRISRERGRERAGWGVGVEIETDRRTDRQIKIEINREINKERQTDRDRQTETDRQNRQIDKQTGRETNRQTSRQTEKERELEVKRNIFISQSNHVGQMRSTFPSLVTSLQFFMSWYLAFKSTDKREKQTSLCNLVDVDQIIIIASLSFYYKCSTLSV